MELPVNKSLQPSSSGCRLKLENLSIAERIILAEQIWDSIVDEQESLGLTEAQQDELDRRLEGYHASPDEGASWEDVRKNYELA